MNEEEKKAVKYFYNLRATIDESNMLFDEEINVKHGKETIKQITIILNLIEKLQKENEILKEEKEQAWEEWNNLEQGSYETEQKLKQQIKESQKENEDLKAKLEYKEYGDLDNTEFEKYINEIVETRTKELREQLEEEQELNKIIKETRINKILENNIEVKKLREENENLRKELNAENKRCMMLAIEKQDYFEKYRYHLQQNERLTKEFSNVILVQKVKDKIRHYQELQDNYIKKYDEINEGLQAMINALQELIEEREEK